MRSLCIARPLIVLFSTLMISSFESHTSYALRQTIRSQITGNVPGRPSRSFHKSPAEMNQVPGLLASTSSGIVGGESTEVATEVLDTNHTTQRPLTVIRISSFFTMLSLALVAFSPASVLIAKLGSDRATSLLSMLTAGAALVEITLSPALGSVIDSIGRKPVLVSTLLATCVVNLVVALNSSQIVSVCLAKFVTMLCMSWFFIANQAITSDIAASDPGRLSSIMGVQMALVGAGFFIGALVAGRLADVGGLSLSYAVSASIGALSFILVSLGMPETLPRSKRVAFHAPAARRLIRQSPLSCTRLLFRHGRQVQTLAILLLFQSLPMFMGDVLQVFAKTEWNLSTKEYSSFIALWSITGIVANTVGSFLVRTFGIKRFMAIATLSSMGAPIGASFFGFKGTVVGSIVGFLGAAQAMGINAALISQGKESGVPQGELAGERASLVALLKVIGPILYSTLYVQGRGKVGMKQLPFVFNIVLAAAAFVVSQLYLPSLDDRKQQRLES